MPDTTSGPHPLLPEQGAVTLYTTSWCPFCRLLTTNLRAAGVPFVEVDIDRDEQAALFVESVNGGDRLVPTVVYPDGSTAANPPAHDVTATLAA